MASTPRILIGCAGWALPRPYRGRFPAGDSNLERYAGRLPAAEINSSFYRPHRASTYEKWAASVPRTFRFSVKVPQAITHDLRLVGAGPALDAFLARSTALGTKLGCLLLQFPPSLAFDRRSTARFFGMLRKRHTGDVVVEPRHASWFGKDAEKVLVSARIGRVAADPPRTPAGVHPGGWRGIAYYRLHGSPVIYRSTYDVAYLKTLADRLKKSATEARQTWCIFDNTMLGGATANALELVKRLPHRG
jgi:uncharacterized protein YecE (DUF72 family)